MSCDVQYAYECISTEMVMLSCPCVLLLQDMPHPRVNGVPCPCICFIDSHQIHQKICLNSSIQYTKFLLEWSVI